MIGPRLRGRFVQLAPLLTPVTVLAVACERPGEMPRHVKQGLSDFYESAKWVKDLPPPADATAGGLGGGVTAGDGEHFQFAVSTSLSAEEVLEHYSVLLEARGWQASQRLIEETVAVETFRFTDAGARRRHGMLYTTTGDSDDGRVAVAIRVTRLPDLAPQ